ncbi:LicD family protein [Butyrivibrio sp. WCD3002]|uniref:LicD family protein n=1 Tax=Butyrivibrio sp. WCD3002 TaxID=1280676 RepID=UPI000427C97F|nr:LicD family protein [Butyrivibrio sp. WCD3002]
MLKKHNFVVPLLDVLMQEITEKKYVSVVWLGVHPWLSVIVQALYDYGIDNVRVLDNDLRKIGKVIIPYKKQFSNIISYKRVVVEPVRVKTISEDALIVMANTHYAEFKAQLCAEEISDERIINLYDLSREHIEYKKVRNCFDASHIKLSLKEVQKLELNLLKDFSDFCEDKKLKYFLGGGTLIGALRHEGFIPWDDDIDVYMPFEDFTEFIKEYSEHGKNEVFYWEKDDDFVLQFAQVVNPNTKIFRDYDWMFGAGELSVFIDIFPIAGYPSEPEAIERQWQRNLELDADWFYYAIIKDVPNINSVDIRKRVIQERHSRSFYQSEYVGNVIRTVHRPWAVPANIYSDYKMVKFEDGYFRAPIGYEQYLKYRYGDYMVLPPVEKREQHLFPSYYV